MSDKDKHDIAEMVKTAKFLAENDPQSLPLIKSGMDLLKARYNLEKQKGPIETQTDERRTQ